MSEVGVPGKKYGLKLNPKAVAFVAAARKQNALVGRKRPASQISDTKLQNAFGGGGEDDDDESAGPQTQEEVNRLLAAGGGYAELRQRRQKRDLEQVLLQDETAFEFDAVYHQLQSERAAEAVAHQAEKRQRKARYVQDLLKHAEERERERAIVFERKLLRERAAEDHLYGDKERFVTRAYKQKLLEDELWKQQQQEKDARDAATSAERLGQQGLGSFHRNLMMAGAGSRSALVEADRQQAEAQRKQQELQAQEDRKRLLEQRIGSRAAPPGPASAKAPGVPSQANAALGAAAPAVAAEAPLAASRAPASTPEEPVHTPEPSAADQLRQAQREREEREERARAARERYLARKQQRSARHDAKE